MTAITVILELRPSTELLLAIDGLAQAFNRFADRGQPASKAPPPTKVGATAVAPEAAPAASDPSKAVMSLERAQLLRREWPLGVDAHATLRRFNELLGKKIDVGRLGIEAGMLGLKRPRGFDPRTAPQTYDEAMARQPASPESAGKPFHIGAGAPVERKRTV
jgi:hypothetical protein